MIIIVSIITDSIEVLSSLGWSHCIESVLGLVLACATQCHWLLLATDYTMHPSKAYKLSTNHLTTSQSEFCLNSSSVITVTSVSLCISTNLATALYMWAKARPLDALHHSSIIISASCMSVLKWKLLLARAPNGCQNASETSSGRLNSQNFLGEYAPDPTARWAVGLCPVVTVYNQRSDPPPSTIM